MKKMISLILPFSFFVISYSLSAQNVGVGTAAPHNSAVLDVQSNNKGMLVPRIALVAANAAAPVTNPANALLVYNTATAGSGINAVTPGFYYWNAAVSRWTAINSNSSETGSWGDCNVKNVSGYELVTTNDGAHGDAFGISVSISGNFAIIGASSDDIGVNNGQGSAYIYSFNGTSWTLFQKITAADGSASDFFGRSVSISGNYAVVGAYSDDVGANAIQGSVYVFFFNGSSWVQTQQLFHPAGQANDEFGISVCLKNNILIVGAWTDDVAAADQGSAHIFQFNGSNWVYQSMITASDAMSGDRFGFSVSTDGIRVIVGAPYDDTGGTSSQGSAYVYSYNGAAWSQQQRLFVNLTAANNNYFGYSVCIAGNYCLVGEPGLSSESGAIYVWQFSTTWTNVQRVIPPGVSGIQSYAGRGIAMSGDYFITGAPFANVNGVPAAGRVFIYKNFSGIWRLYEEFSDPAAGTSDMLGEIVGLDNNRFICSSYLAPDQMVRGLVIFGKIE